MHLSANVFGQEQKKDYDAIYRELSEYIKENKTKIIVLDDDPTGVQTVHDVYVYTQWDLKTIGDAFDDPNKVSYVLTNSRGLTEAETAMVHHEICCNIHAAAQARGREYLIISRSDSTLRGHYPLEMEILRDATERMTGKPVDGEIFCPFFKEGGRFTINGMHYVQYEEELIPAAETEFAADRTFGYRNSWLPAYIEEKSKGRYPAEQVKLISLESLRRCKVAEIEEKLMQSVEFGKICVDAVSYCDLAVFCTALYRVLRKGKRFLFRTAASFVKTFCGISDRPLLTHQELTGRERSIGGLVIAGSHTEKTSRQLNNLLCLSETVGIPFHAGMVLKKDDALEEEILRCLRMEEEAILQGKTAVCYSERETISKENEDEEAALKLAVKISENIVRLAGDLSVCPAFIIAKGGITSSDIATKALGVRKALVVGQILPGVPVWKTEMDCRFPEIPYVVFPGNVGNDDGLYDAVMKLTGRDVNDQLTKEGAGA